MTGFSINRYVILSVGDITFLIAFSSKIGNKNVVQNEKTMSLESSICLYVHTKTYYIRIYT